MRWFESKSRAERRLTRGILGHVDYILGAFIEERGMKMEEEFSRQRDYLDYRLASLNEQMEALRELLNWKETRKADEWAPEVPEGDLLFLDTINQEGRINRVTTVQNEVVEKGVERLSYQTVSGGYGVAYVTGWRWEKKGEKK